MAENSYGVQFGGPWRYGWQPGMTAKPDELTVLEYTNPVAAEIYGLLAKSSKRDNKKRGSLAGGLGS